MYKSKWINKNKDKWNAYQRVYQQEYRKAHIEEIRLKNKQWKRISRAKQQLKQLKLTIIKPIA